MSIKKKRELQSVQGLNELAKVVSVFLLETSLLSGRKTSQKNSL